MRQTIQSLFVLLILATVPAHSQQAASRPAAASAKTSDDMPAKAIMWIFDTQIYEVRAAAEAMPEDKWDFRPASGVFKNEKPEYGPSEMRTFREQVKHVACSNFAFSAELDGVKPPDACDKGGPSPANTRTELLTYLRDSFVALKKSLNAITTSNMADPINGPYGGPTSRLGIAELAIWHDADHCGQMAIYLRLNNIVPPASRNPPPELHEKY